MERPLVTGALFFSLIDVLLWDQESLENEDIYLGRLCGQILQWDGAARGTPAPVSQRERMWRLHNSGVRILQSVFRSPPRLATSRPDLKMIRRVADLKTLCIMERSPLPVAIVTVQSASRWRGPNGFRIVSRSF